MVPEGSTGAVATNASIPESVVLILVEFGFMVRLVRVRSAKNSQIKRVWK